MINSVCQKKMTQFGFICFLSKIPEDGKKNQIETAE
jgi:hypothetical protein